MLLVCLCVCVCVFAVMGDTDLWVYSPACMFVPVSILAQDMGRKLEEEMYPLSLLREHGSFKDIFLEQTTSKFTSSFI